MEEITDIFFSRGESRNLRLKGEFRKASEKVTSYLEQLS